MKKFYYLIAMAMMAFTFTSCEDVPEPFGQPINPNKGSAEETVDPSGDGKSVATAYNATGVVDYVKSLGADVPSDKEVYIKGYATDPSAVNSKSKWDISAQYKNATFGLADTPNGKAKFVVYRAKGLGNTDVTDENFVKEGDEVVVYGKVVNYQGNTPETVQGTAYVYSVNGKGGGDTPTPTPGGDAKAVSVSDFIAAAVSTTDWYQLTGTIKNLKDGDQYGNFDIEDATGSVYVYGLLSEKGGEKKKFQELVAAKGIANGKKITIIGNRGEFNGTVQVANAYFVSIDGEGGGGGDTPIPTGDNLLTNGDFETWTGETPDNWKTSSSAGNATLTKSTDAHGGSYSVSVGFNATSNKRLGYKELNLKAGTYTFSFYAKATTADKSQAQAGYVPVTDGTAGQYKYGGYVSLTNTEWTLVSITFTLDAATTVSLVMMNPKNSDYCVAQNVLVDDANLTTSDGGIVDGGGSGGDTPTPPSGNHGTAEAPLTVAQAIALIDAESIIDEAYVKGIISKIDSYNATYKSITYWISDDGTTTTQLQVYSGKGLNGADFSSKDDLTVGKTVVIKGKLKKYNTTYEFDKTSSIISIE